MIMKNGSDKFDIDSEQGCNACKNFLKGVEKLSSLLPVRACARQYRLMFTKAYQILYKDGFLCYLTEILDSAQENFACLWVNGQKYTFSQDVIDSA
jgi:hypothetical protein